ncbi:MAG TPA: NAD(P)/FAD-dependent oxidoreductase [Rudaea sp.]|nr:NAD(P)/FAD-dependent oxidoreductase [Rudaea sp.]
MNRNKITLVGAGLVGALLATLLAQRGFPVEVFERRPDPRKAGFLGGRSINLALAERGWHGLRVAGLQQRMRPIAVMMRGRMVHHRDGRTELLRYGRDDSEVIWSVNRGTLNMTLLDAAEAAGARIHFDQRLVTVDWDKSTLQLCDEAGATREHAASLLIGADGAGSALRAAMAQRVDLGERFEPLDHGYKELEIPALSAEANLAHRVGEPDSTGLPPSQPSPASGGRSKSAASEQPSALSAQPYASPSSALSSQPSPFAMEPNALHIWPRGNYMCIALPNAEGSFTVTLFLPNHAKPDAPSFASLDSPQAVREFFARDFADAVPLMPDYEHDFAANPTGVLGTLYLDRWHIDGRALLLGDAAHAIVPFHGQGMNCGFEDAVELAELMDGATSDAAAVFAEFQRRRKPNADAIAAMALENYIEMRDSVADAHFLLMRALERTLATRHPGRFVPRYWMVTFSRLPYATAFARGEIQASILLELTAGKKTLDDIDLAHADALITARLPPLAA